VFNAVHNHIYVHVLSFRLLRLLPVDTGGCGVLDDLIEIPSYTVLKF
jgi:hypothetical protein